MFSFVVPLITVSVPASRTIPIISVMTSTYINPPEAVAGTTQQTSEATDPLPTSLTWIYLLGVLFFSSRFIRSIFALYKLARRGSVDPQRPLHVRRTDLKKSFTFLHMIYLPKEETDPIVLQHEQAHVTQLHWIDLLLTEIALIILWFNPFVRMLRNELRLQHEFLADRAVMSTGVSFEDYAQCLIRNINVAGSIDNATSPLSSSSNKKRILMMTKKKTPAFSFALYVMLLPVAAVLLMAFGKKHNPTEPVAKAMVASTSVIQYIPNIAPVDFEKVTMVVLYGERKNPAKSQGKKHTGIDFQMPEGSNVYATADGTVEFARYNDNYGNYVRVKHSDTYSSQYSHLTRATVKQGDKITQGQVIGLVGSTGLSSKGPHLHYEIIKDKIMVDPKDYLPNLPGTGTQP
jgi:beta-lactamase regulating signal transducer with metallopeptidase domain